jgi:hypothetical protein
MDCIMEQQTFLLKVFLVFITMFAADFTTRYYAKTAISRTMRDNPYPEWMSPLCIKFLTRFYSISQILGTMNILMSNDMAKSFLIIIPIQIAPFLMTLVKKGIMNQTGWHIYYTIAIMVNYIYGYYTDLSLPLWLYTTLISGFIGGRFIYNINKYILWSMVVFCMAPYYLDTSGASVST